MSVCSGNGIVTDSTSSAGESNRHSSTRVACSEKIAKLTPTPSQVAPSGDGAPGHTRMFLVGTEGVRYHVPGRRCNASLPSWRSQQPKLREQPDPEHQRDHREGGENADNRKDENPVSSGGFRLRMRVALEQREIPDIRLPSKIKEVANNRDQANHHIDRGVDQHSQLNDPWNAHPDAVQEQQRRE